MENGSSVNGHPEDLSEVMDFSSYELRTTIRLIVESGESRRVDVRQCSKRGAVFVKEGEIYRVETDETQGDEAFFEILAWDKAVHSDTLQGETPDQNVRIPTNVFLDLLDK